MKKKTSAAPIIIAVVALIFIAVTASVLIPNRPSEDKARKLALDYLTTKYGDGNWQIHESIRDAGSTLNGFVESKYDNGYIFRVTSTYTDGEGFMIDVDDTKLITTDSFLPTYYSIKYGLEYKAPTEGDMSYDYSDLINRMVYITDYHYPYNDYKYSSSGSISQRPKARIGNFEMGSFYDPISVSRSPEQSKILDIIPDNGSIPDIMDIIASVEDYYSSGLVRNKDNHDAELFSLVFEQKAGEEEIKTFIKEHIAPVDGLEPMFKYSN